MKKYKTIVLWLLFIVMVVLGSGCQTVVEPEGEMPTGPQQEELAGEENGEAETANQVVEPTLVVTTSFFPYYDLVRQLGGSLVQVHQLVPAGADPHSYEPTPRDLIQLQSSHLFLFNGVDFENWGEAAVTLLEGTETVVIRAGDLVELLKVSDHPGHAGHDHGAYDPHIWTDPLNMKTIANHVVEKLIALDPDNEEAFRKNHDVYVTALAALDEAFKAVAREAEHHILLVSHSAFGYLAHRYGFEQIAVAGISPHAEPTPGRLAELTNLARRYQLEYIFFETLANPRTAEILAEEAGLTPLMLYNAEGLTSEQQAAGETYISLMQKNVNTLKRALVKQ